jgi:hypothetical protein
MRNRLALPATLATMVLALTLGQNAWAQQETRRPPGRPGENPSAGQNQNQHANAGQDRNQTVSEGETIRGVVAAITAEGEATFDFRSNRAVMAEAAFLTVVGSPVKSEAGDSGRRTNANDKEKFGSSGRRRHNVYMVWLTPRTKICESSGEHGKSNQTQSQPGEKKEVMLDQLEVGDHVEIQFSRREESGANSFAHQTEQMRRKHGRHRTFVGNAASITILASYKDEDRSGSKTEGNSGERRP